MSQRSRVLPGFGLSLGFTLAYLSLIVLIPLSAVFHQIARYWLGRFMGNFKFRTYFKIFAVKF